MVTTTQLAGLLGVTEAQHTQELQHALDVAVALADNALATPWREVPDAVYDEIVSRTAVAVFQQAKGNTGDQLLGADGTTAFPVANDPLRKSWDLIKRYTDRV